MTDILKIYNSNEEKTMLATTLSTIEETLHSHQESIMILGSFLTAMLVGFWIISSYLGPTMG